MSGILSFLSACYRGRGSAHTSFVTTPNAPKMPIRDPDTLTGKVSFGDIALPGMPVAKVPSTLQTLAPTAADAVWALGSTRIPGGGFVTASSQGEVTQLDGQGARLHTLSTVDDGDKPIYSLCMVGDRYVLGNALGAQSSGAPFALKLWDLQTHGPVGQLPTEHQYATMAYAGNGLVVGSNYSSHHVWLHDLARNSVRVLDGISEGGSADNFAVLAPGYVAARLRRDRAGSSASTELVIWQADRDWAAHIVTVPPQLERIRGLLPLDGQRLLVLGDRELADAVVWDGATERFGEIDAAFGTIARHRWVEPSPEHEAACANYREHPICGGVNPAALSAWHSHMLLENRPDGVAAWDLHYRTPAWDGTTLAVRPSGPTFGMTYKVLRLT